MKLLKKIAAFIKNFTMVAFGLLNLVLGGLFWYVGADVWLFWQNLPAVDLHSPEGFSSTVVNILFLGGATFISLPFLQRHLNT